MKDQTQQEATRIWRMLSPMVRGLIRSETQNCLRMKNAVIVYPPDGQKVGVMRPNDTQIFYLPYVSTLVNAQVGDTVYTQYWQDMSNAIVVDFGNAKQP